MGANGARSIVPVSVSVPAYQSIFPGGDTYGVFNYEYRIPIVGPVTLAPFIDVGVDRLSLPSQLGLNVDRVATLNAEYPQNNFGTRAYIAPGTEKPRASIGLELQVLNARRQRPISLYWAYNLSDVNTNLSAPIAAGLNQIINGATYKANLSALGQSFQLTERHSLFRFSVGRTF